MPRGDLIWKTQPKASLVRVRKSILFMWWVMPIDWVFSQIIWHCHCNVRPQFVSIWWVSVYPWTKSALKGKGRLNPSFNARISCRERSWWLVWHPIDVPQHYLRLSSQIKASSINQKIIKNANVKVRIFYDLVLLKDDCIVRGLIIAIK